MSGTQTIGLTLTAWLIVTALGFAACSRQEPPMPRNPDAAWLERRNAEPARLADTATIPLEVFSDDAVYRYEQRCSAEGGELFGRVTFVRCEGGGPSGASWFYTVHDVPADRRGVRP